jgi:hypothetical protein
LTSTFDSDLIDDTVDFLEMHSFFVLDLIIRRSRSRRLSASMLSWLSETLSQRDHFISRGIGTVSEFSGSFQKSSWKDESALSLITIWGFLVAFDSSSLLLTSAFEA